MNDIPDGLCQCGCGQKTRIAGKTHRQIGQVKGVPLRYIKGHNDNRNIRHRGWESRYTVDPASGCWLWKGHRRPDGYAYLTVNGCGAYAHRAFYERQHGPIPEGLEIDHLCHVRHCVNPAHLEAVKPAVNSSRRRPYNTRPRAS